MLHDDDVAVRVDGGLSCNSNHIDRNHYCKWRDSAKDPSLDGISTLEPVLRAYAFSSSLLLLCCISHSCPSHHRGIFASNDIADAPATTILPRKGFLRKKRMVYLVSVSAIKSPCERCDVSTWKEGHGEDLCLREEPVDLYQSWERFCRKVGGKKIPNRTLHQHQFH